MYYSSIALLAVIMHIIINHDVLRHGLKMDKKDLNYYYARFLNAVITYHIADMIWGVLYENKLATLATIDTYIYFIAMSMSVLYWNKFITDYAGGDERQKKFMMTLGNFLFIFQLGTLLINVLYPIYFKFEQTGEYIPLPARYWVLALQITLMAAVSISSYIKSLKKEEKWNHCLVVSISSFMMTIAITLQMYYPLLPFYSAGFLVALTLIHVYVIEDEKTNSLKELNESLIVQQKQQKELEESREKINTDVLTGSRSKYAFVEKEEEVNEILKNNKDYKFAIAVFDLNGLKPINDTLGHNTGDEFIKQAYNLIYENFNKEPVYRIGGDEFALVLENETFENRKSLVKDFKSKVLKNLEDKKVVVSVGMSDYNSKEDNFFDDVFNKADRSMYADKQYLESKGALKRD